MAAPDTALTAYRIAVPVADLTDKPARIEQISPRSSQMLYGELFNGAEEQGDWVRGTCAHDGYKGWIHKSQLAVATAEPTHFVDLPWTHIYPSPDFKTRPLLGLPFMARLAVNADLTKNGFTSIPGKGWVFSRHIKPLDALAKTDPVYTAMRFLGCPYLYGGRSAVGMDCSALVQLALMRAGQSCPRDSGPQERALGQNVARDKIAQGDFVFFPGHVGIMVDDQHIVNASARTMSVEVERLADLDRIYAADGKSGITAIRRVDHNAPAPGHAPNAPFTPGE